MFGPEHLIFCGLRERCCWTLQVPLLRSWSTAPGLAASNSATRFDTTGAPQLQPASTPQAEHISHVAVARRRWGQRRPDPEGMRSVWQRGWLDSVSRRVDRYTSAKSRERLIMASTSRSSPRSREGGVHTRERPKHFAMSSRPRDLQRRNWPRRQMSARARSILICLNGRSRQIRSSSG